MEITKRMPDAVVSAAAGMMSPFVPEMTPASLLRAIKAYGVDGARSEDADRMVTREQAARMLNVSIPTLWRMVNAGRIRKVKISDRAARYRLEDVRAIMAGAVEHSSTPMAAEA